MPRFFLFAMTLLRRFVGRADSPSTELRRKLQASVLHRVEDARPLSLPSGSRWRIR